MSNAIDRLEEEYNDLKAYERKVHAMPDSDPAKVEKLDFLAMLYERFINTFGEHAKPLLAVVRAGERVENATCICPTHLPPGGCADECEMHLARKALRLALATLKETPL